MKNKKIINKFLIPAVINMVSIFMLSEYPNSVTAKELNKTNKQTVVQDLTAGRVTVKCDNMKNKSEYQNSESVITNFEKAKVTCHIDGSTIGVTLQNGEYRKVRLIGINMPKTKNVIMDQLYATQASNYVKSQLYGKTVLLRVKLFKLFKVKLFQPKLSNNMVKMQIK
ncbi:hypothetical protein [Clostridium sp. JS66]|uniref:thermonuclease family protein n=1 Tax=Clostridium sp. JS66 TaxID=3064705 RepID=UPI00298E441D|nr:hypothetical protein [Clostridium sp. JS66]WPC39664.1 hypothetical protein Q6H37_17285 [Clostridium sp. JS66]